VYTATKDYLLTAEAESWLLTTIIFVAILFMPKLFHLGLSPERVLRINSIFTLKALINQPTNQPTNQSKIN